MGDHLRQVSIFVTVFYFQKTEVERESWQKDSNFCLYTEEKDKRRVRAE
jgi:hypothetical protein